MGQTYELNARNVLAIAREQLATLAFKEQFDYVLYQEFNSKGECVWSNLVSGLWAFQQAVCPFHMFFWAIFLIRCLGRALTRPKQPWGNVCPDCCWE